MELTRQGWAFFIMAAANTDKFKKTKARHSTTVSSSCTDADTTISCADLSGVPTDTAVNFTLNRVDSNDAVQGTWETVTGVVSGNNITSAVRGVEGTASAWGVGTVVEVLWTADNVNDMVDGIIAEHAQDGTHGAVTATSLTMSGVIDANGQKIDLDADADTSITADTDDQIDIEIAGADDFQFTANTFTALSGSTIKTDTIAETTADAGVTVDGVSLKDNAILTSGNIATSGGYLVGDNIGEYTAGAGVTIDGVLAKDNEVTLDNAKYYEGKTSAGTVKELLGLTANDHFVLGEMDRQGGSATDWNSGGTDNYTSGKFTIQAGMSAAVTGGGTLAVTFPQAFSAPPIAVVTPGTTTAHPMQVLVNSATQMTIYNFGPNSRSAYWIAIGPIA